MYQLATLGRLLLTADGAPLLTGRRKLLCVLAYLTLARRPVGRAQLAALFWPTDDEPHARRSVRQALAELRRALGDALAEDAAGISLVPGVIEVDARQMESALAAGDPSQAALFWQGEFMPGAEEVGGADFRAWLEAEREARRGLFARIAALLADQAEQRNDWPAAIAITRRWIESSPLDEAANLRLIRVLHLAGHRREAARHRAEFIRRVQRDLDAEPTPRFLGATSALASVEGSPAIGAAAALLVPDLVGREPEWSALGQLWSQAAHGLPAVALIEGAEGSGRSRLLEEFLRSLPPDACVLRARAFVAEQGRSWVLARHLLAPIADAPGLVAAPAAALRALATLVPDITSRLPELPQAEQIDDLADAAVRVLRDVAEERSLVVAVDDAHLADARSRELLEMLARRPVPGLLLLLTCRSGSMPELGSVVRQEPGASPRRHLELKPLSTSQTAQLLASMGEFDPRERQALAERLHAESDGNPLVSVQFLNGLVRDGWIAAGADGYWKVQTPPDAALPLPASLHEAVRARLARLAPDRMEVLRSVAVLGRDADLERLQEMSGLDRGTLEDGIAELVAGRLLRPMPGVPLRFEFSHELERRTVYEGLWRRERQALHRRAARVLRHETGPGEIAAAAYHRSQGGSWARFARWPWVAAAAVVAALALMAARWIGREPADVGRRIGIVPFVATGSTPRALAETVPQLLTLALRAAPDVQVVDQPTGQPLVLEGSVSARGPRVEVHATLLDARHAGRIVATVSAAGEVEELPAMAQDLARRLLPDAESLREPGFRLGAVQTASLDALRDYLAGEDQARRFEMEAAARSYFHAVRKDPGFAAAWHALARINAWFSLPDRARALADSSVSHDTRLAPRDRLILEGWQAFAHGRADEAERHFQSVLGFAPGSPEATIGMAEVLMHHNWTRGRDIAESWPFWTAANRAAPDDWRPYVHLWEEAAREGRLPEAAAGLRQLMALEGGAASSPLAIDLAAVEGDSAGVRHMLDSIPDMNAWELTQLTEELGATIHRLDLAHASAAALSAPAQTDELRAFGHEELAFIAMAAGRWRLALLEVDSAAALEPVSAGTVRALLWSAPFLPANVAPDSLRRAARRDLAEAAVHPVGRTFDFWFDFDRAREPLLRTYLASLLASELGVAAPPLAQPAVGDDSARTVWPGLRRSAAAWGAISRGDSAAALALLRGSWDGTEATEASLSTFLARPWDRYLLAQLLERTGQEGDALGWYGGLGVVSLADYAYAAPAALARGRILDGLGRRDEARREYELFAALWAQADPEFQPQVAAVRARLAALTPADRRSGS